MIYAATLDSSKHGVVSTETLTKKPTEKTTIGVVPYFIKDHQIYLLLGRERIDEHKKEKAGKFSDFGGGVKSDGTTLIQNAIRELEEESMGQILLAEEDLLKKGSVLFKISPENREIFYIFYPISEQEYKISRRLNALWPVLCPYKPEDNYCEKDQFLWINAQDLIKNQDSKDKATHVHNIDGKQQALSLREFFVRDCLNHPDFLKFLGKLNGAQDNPKISNKLNY